MKLKKRLEEGVRFLEELDRMRLETGAPLAGFDQECLIIAQELRELEEDILRDPGPLAALLNPLRRRSRGTRETPRP